MSTFQEEMDKRMRRLCGVTDDSLKVVLYEHLSDSNWSGYADDTDFGASYEVEIVVYESPEAIKRLASRTFSGTVYMIQALEGVEL